MTRVIVVADGGPTLEALTRTLHCLKGVDIVRHLSARPPVELIQRLEPDLIFIDVEMPVSAEAGRQIGVLVA